MSDIKVSLTQKQCDLIALALDKLLNAGGLSEDDLSETAGLFFQFDTLSDEPVKKQPKATGLRLVYDRDSNIRPFFPK